ncbi:MAG: 3-hydroxy-9,10-secoandrosta-1,3,5(10)-triene-9,17-dione monooxygenase reductase subunit [Sciscionella sp.]
MTQPEVFDDRRFRQALGHFCTGVTIITAMADGVPVGFACQSFSSLSLDPPLVLFCPSRSSRTWHVIERAGSFCVNVLAHTQRELSTVFGTKGVDKFATVQWSRSPSGAPVLHGTLTWIDCTIETVHTEGDHHVVIGRVRALGDHRDDRPLLFYRGAYTGIELDTGGTPLAAGADADETFFTWPRPDDWL